MQRITTKNARLDRAQRDKGSVEHEAFERLKAEPRPAFAAPGDSYRCPSAAKVITRNS